jgi:hypothetical protein
MTVIESLRREADELEPHFGRNSTVVKLRRAADLLQRYEVALRAIADSGSDCPTAMLPEEFYERLSREYRATARKALAAGGGE